jgi:tRNA pseudouridine55 synthase
MTFPGGFFVIDKPTGVTSFSMVSLVRRLTGVRRVGHAGTLDPLATGVLPVAVGQATRLIEYLDVASKTYVARVRFGATTDTYDAEGAVTATGDPALATRAAIEALLPAFIGDIDQTPPAFSAIKVAGQPLYRYARAGEVVELKPRRVRIDRITLLRFDPPEAEIEVFCGKGTYIRSLAHDLGQRLGCGAHLAALRRTSTGGFSIGDAITPDALTALAEAGRLEDALLAPDRAVERLRAAIVSAAHAADVRAGRDLCLECAPGARKPAADEICRAYEVDGSFLGVIEARPEGSWHPAKVVAHP